MKKTLVITVWTSLINNVVIENKNKLLVLQKSLNSENWQDYFDNNNDHCNDILQEINNYQFNFDGDYWKYSAELKTFKLIKDKNEEISQIYLLYSDTIWWDIAQRRLVNIFKNNLSFKNVEAIKIEWWQVDNANDFHTKWIKNFYENLNKIIWDQIILAPVGWYKDGVIVATKIATINKREIACLLDDNFVII